jgi:hypothetical protein
MRKKKQNIVDKREKTKEYQVGFKMLPTLQDSTKTHLEDRETPVVHFK